MINFDVVISKDGLDHIVIEVCGSAPKLDVKPMDLNPFTGRFMKKIRKELEKKGIANDTRAESSWAGLFDTKRSYAKGIFFNGKDEEAAKAADEEGMEKNLKICEKAVADAATKLGIAAKYLSVKTDL